MTGGAVLVLAIAIACGVYTYLGYPAVLQLLTWRRARAPRAKRSVDLPSISIVLPVYNEASVIAATLERLLALDYPAERRQILVVSDASTDGTDDIVTTFAARGVELLRLPARAGKTAAENAARSRLRGELIVNTDASVRVDAKAVRALVAAFEDPTVGVASGRDVSVSNIEREREGNGGEGAYVGYEMWIRDLETALGGIVGASGCLYAIRANLHAFPVPDELSRDFSAALTARAHGYRAVSVPEALCYVPRGRSVQQEYRRKVRTITRGLATLAHNRALLNPLRYGRFAWMLFSHKVCRWLLPWAGVLALVTLAPLALTYSWARLLFGGGLAVLGLAAVGWLWPRGKAVPRLVALPAYVVAGNVAVLRAWVRLVTGRAAPLWEPTRRDAPPVPSR